MSAHAVCVTSGCHASSLLGFNVSHHKTTTANAPKTMTSFNSLPRTNMTAASSASRNTIATNVPAFGKSKWSAPKAQVVQTNATNHAKVQPMDLMTRMQEGEAPLGYALL